MTTGQQPAAQADNGNCEHDYTVIALDYLGGKIELPVKAENAFAAVDMAIADKRVRIVTGIIYHRDITPRR